MTKFNQFIRNPAVLHGKHQGEHIVIVGNAPSLNRVDLSQLDNTTTIGCNRILQHKTFRPTYLMVSDRRPFYHEQSLHNYNRNAKTVNIMLSTTIFDPTIKCYDTKPSALPGYEWYPWKCGVSSTEFNWTDFAKPLCSFASITGPMLQAAIIMGASKVGIVGVDMQAPKANASMHFYENEGPWEGYKGLPEAKPSSSIVKPTTLAQYKQAFEALGDMGIEVLNLSPDQNTVFSKEFGCHSYEGFIDAVGTTA
jgi:hypothetical protein